MSDVDEDLRLIVDRFLREAPSLEDLHRDHVRAYGESIPYLFIAEVARELARRVEDSLQLDVLSAIGVAEDVFANGSDAQKDLIGAGFLEAFPSPGDPGEELRELLAGPLRLQLLRWMR